MGLASLTLNRLNQPIGQVQSISQKVDEFGERISKLEQTQNTSKESLDKTEKMERYIGKLIPWTHEVSQNILHLEQNLLEVTGKQEEYYTA